MALDNAALLEVLEAMQAAGGGRPRPHRRPDDLPGADRRRAHQRDRCRPLGTHRPAHDAAQWEAATDSNLGDCPTNGVSGSTRRALTRRGRVADDRDTCGCEPTAITRGSTAGAAVAVG